jgi:hypothetical protein
MNVKCGCAVCAGSGSGVASASANRPGRDAIDVRVGTHETFLATMKQRISSPEHRAGLAGLSARDSGDASIAMLDAWATVADVLTFYQERIANEGYLHTAREAASLDALAHLVGYEPRPGVASSVYLAYTVDDSAGSVAPRRPSKPARISRHAALGTTCKCGSHARSASRSHPASSTRLAVATIS